MSAREHVILIWLCLAGTWLFGDCGGTSRRVDEHDRLIFDLERRCSACPR